MWLLCCMFVLLSSWPLFETLDLAPQPFFIAQALILHGDGLLKSPDCRQTGFFRNCAVVLSPKQTKLRTCFQQKRVCLVLRIIHARAATNRRTKNPGPGDRGFLTQVLDQVSIHTAYRYMCDRVSPVVVRRKKIALATDTAADVNKSFCQAR